MKEDIKYWVWLSSLPGIGSIRSQQLLELFGSPRNLWYAKKRELEKVRFLTGGMLEQIVSYPLKTLAQKHMETIHKYDIQVVRIIDESYPELLRNIYDPPTVIFVRGTLKPDEKAIAVVGSRNSTEYGNTIAGVLAEEIARQGITVVSGLAKGIDSSAHKGALKSGGRTIAVLGCGPDIVYPPDNHELMEKIIHSGAVVTEFIPGTPPLRGNFPARNRIISGLSMGVAVVEASQKSGSLITADFALEQGREVFAVPGNVNSRNSTGTNRLIREGAKIITSVKDILEEFNGIGPMDGGYLFKLENVDSNGTYSSLNEDEVKIIKCLSKDTIHIDVISENSGLDIKDVSSILFMLEVKGLVEQFPGKMFCLSE